MRRHRFGVGTPVLVILASALAAACTPHVRAQLVVVVDSNLVPGVDYDHVRFEVQSADGGIQRQETRPLNLIAGDAGVSLPFSFGVFPSNGDPTRAVTLSAEALLGETHVVSYQAITAYEANHVLELDLFLERACVGHESMCAAGQQCGRGGTCVSVTVSPTTLPTYNPDGGFDAAQPADLGIDAVLPDVQTPDTGTDVPIDVPVDVPPPPPRLIAPMSTSLVGSTTPTLTWNLPAPYDGGQFDLCGDRACANVVQSVNGGRTATPAPLAPGVWYWRVWGTQTGMSGHSATPTATWEFRVLSQPFLGTADAGPPPQATLDGFYPDLNGDGIADVAIGEPQQPSSGAVVVYYGAATFGTATPPALPFFPPTPGTGFGSVVASAGDVNGDGFGDLVLGTPTVGGAYVYFGNATTTLTGPLQISLPASLGCGSSAVGLGDVDADGYGDVAIGCPTDGGGTVRIYFGGPASATTTRAATLSGSGGGQFGTSISGGSDINGDGIADFVVGDPAIAFPGTDAGVQHGQAVVYAGNAAGTLAPLGTFSATAFAGADQFGQSVAATGDLDGDGFADVVIGAPATTVSGGTGAAVVLFGGATSLTPFPSLVGFGDGGTAFAQVVAPAGDVDADGYCDFAIGSSNLFGRGLTQVMRGGTGVRSVVAAFWVYQGIDSTPPVIGGSLAYAGDVNGDGVDDLLAGSQDLIGGADLFLGVQPITEGTPGIPTSIMPLSQSTGFGYSLALNEVGRSTLPFAMPGTSRDWRRVFRRALQ